MGRRWHRILLILILIFPAPLDIAQAQQEDGAVYVVQAGDTLAAIASRFRVSIQGLIQVNQLVQPNNLKPGDRLVLPGFPGVHGVLTARRAGLGENLQRIHRREQIPLDTLLSLNPITSALDLYYGDWIILPQTDPSTWLNAAGSLAPGEPLLEMAIAGGMNPWLVAEMNDLSSVQMALPGDLLFSPSTAAASSNNSLLPWIDRIEVSPQPFVQGDTIELHLHAPSQVQLGGSWMGNDLHFFQDGEGSYAALAGVYALADPGLYPLDLKVQNTSGASYQVEQSFQVAPGIFPQDPHLTVDPQTIDPKITGPENDQVAALVRTSTPVKCWDGPFLSPAYNPKWIISGFGNRRYYNDDPHVYFHTGIDYSGGVGIPIKAAAAGIVVFAGQMTVRGNVTFIDHGWGVYTAYFHQSRIDVKVGDQVQPGQEIGLIGATGRATGAHLHWEVWVDGTQVNPLGWLSQTYP